MCRGEVPPRWFPLTHAHPPTHTHTHVARDLPRSNRSCSASGRRGSRASPRPAGPYFSSQLEYIQQIKLRKYDVYRKQNSLDRLVGVSKGLAGASGPARPASTVDFPHLETGRRAIPVRVGMHTNLTPYGRFLHDFDQIFAICTPAHLYFTRCASERERSERERCASSRVPLAISRFSHFSRFFARARASRKIQVCKMTNICLLYTSPSPRD